MSAVQGIPLVEAERQENRLKRANGHNATIGCEAQGGKVVNDDTTAHAASPGAGAAATLDIPERAMLLPFMPEGGLVMVHAPRGLGKTWFALGLTTALARGGEFLKWTVDKPVGVLIVDGEMDLGALRQRITALCPQPPSAQIGVLSHQHVFNAEELDMNFGRSDWQNRLRQYLDDNPQYKVVLLDNLSCLLPTTAEDKRDDWARDVLPFLTSLRRRGVAVVLIHHSGKSRWSTRIKRQGGPARHHYSA